MADTDTDFSLADLADLDVSEIQEIRFENLPQGIYDFIIRGPELSEGTKDDESIFIFSCKCEVEEAVQLLDKVEDPESLKGKVQNFRQNIEKGAKAEEGIGRTRAFATDVGVDSTGKLGQVIDRMRDHRFRGKIVHTRSKNDPSVSFANIRFEKKQ